MSVSPVTGTTRRNRPTLVCTSCKKRKIKCDKGRPCSSCVRHNIGDTCSYESNWLESTVPNNFDYLQSAKVPVALIQQQQLHHQHQHHQLPAQSTNSAISATQSLPPAPTSSTEPKDEFIPYSHNDITSTITSESVSGSKVTKKSTLPKNTTPNKLNDMVLISRDELRAKLKSHEHDSDEEGETYDDNNKFNYYLNNFVRSFKVFQTTIHIGRDNCPVLNQSISYGIYKDLHQPQFPGSTFVADDLNSDYSPTATTMKVDPSKGYMIGINPYQNEDERINFHEDAPLLRTHVEFDSYDDPATNILGPFSWYQVQRKNYWLSVMRQYVKLQSSEAELATMSVSSRPQPFFSHQSNERLPESQNAAPGSVNSLHSSSTLSENSSPNLSNTSEQVYEGRSFRTTANANTHKPTLTFDVTAPENNELRLVEQIQLMLPNKKVVWYLVRRFFSHVYPFCPYFDERDSRSHFERLIGPESYEHDTIQEIHASQKHDLLHLGILLVMLRLAYLSLFSSRALVNKARLTSNDPSPEAQTMKFLLSNPIDSGTAMVAHVCLNHSQLFHKVRLQTLQLALLLNHYYYLSPEDGDGLQTQDGRIYHGTLVQMAYMLRLHRDPDKVKNSFTTQDERQNDLIRRIWSGLSTKDFVYSFNTGHPQAINKNHYDTKFPTMRPGNESLYDIELDRAVTGFFMFDEYLVKGPMKNILRLCMNVKKAVKLSDLTKYVNQMEVSNSVPLGRIIDYIRPLEEQHVSYSAAKLMKAIITINTRSFFLLVYFCLMNYYEEKGNTSLTRFYLKKLFSLCVDEFVPSFLPFILQGEVCFGEGSGLALNQLVLQSLYRCNEMIMIGIMRTNVSIYRFLKSSDHQHKLRTDPSYKFSFKTMIEFLEVMVKCMKINLLASACLSDRYYFAWAISKSHSFLLKIITNERFYAEFPSREQSSVFSEADTIHDLTLLGRNSCKYIEKVFQKNNDADLNEIIENNKLFSFDSDDNFYQVAHDSLNKSTQVIDPNEQLGNIDFINSLQNESNEFHDLNRSVGEDDLQFYSDFMQTDFGNIPDLTSSNITQKNDLIFSNTSEVDSLWMQLLMEKNSQPLNHTPGTSSYHQHQTKADDGYNNQAVFAALNKVDHLGIFNNIPLDQIFQNHFEVKKD